MIVIRALPWLLLSLMFDAATCRLPCVRRTSHECLNWGPISAPARTNFRPTSREDPILAINYIHFNQKIYESHFSNLVEKTSQTPFRHCFLDDFLRRFQLCNWFSPKVASFLTFMMGFSSLGSPLPGRGGSSSGQA